MQVGYTSSYNAVSSKAVSENKANSSETKDEQSVTEKNILNLANGEINEDTIKDIQAMGGAKAISQAYVMQFQQQALNITMGNSSTQGSLLDLINSSSTAKVANIFSQIDFASIGYDGKNPLAMNSAELNSLLGENGFFGVENTANRIADFVINGAGDDLEKLQAGFEGMKRGFEEAERLWGGKLPQISQDTIDKAIEKVSARIEELGGKAVSINA